MFMSCFKWDVLQLHVCQPSLQDGLLYWIAGQHWSGMRLYPHLFTSPEPHPFHIVIAVVSLQDGALLNVIAVEASSLLMWRQAGGLTMSFGT